MNATKPAKQTTKKSSTRQASLQKRSSTVSAQPSSSDSKTGATESPKQAVKQDKVNIPPKPRSKKEALPEANKQTRLMTLIQRRTGASLTELIEATGWQAHSVRGFISGTLRKKLGLRIDLATNPDGARVYRMVA